MFRPPNINAPTDSGKIKQLEEYLFQLIRELNLKIASLDELLKNSKE